jgi:hypothetical protein
MAVVKARMPSDSDLRSPGTYGWKIVATNAQEIASKGPSLCGTIARISFGILAMHDSIFDENSGSAPALM